MTRILRLLLIVVIVLPCWQPIAAQRAIGGDEPVRADLNEALQYVYKARPNAEPIQVVHTNEAVPNGYARVILAVGIRWNDGYGYQMLFDEDASIYSSYYLNYYGSVNTNSNYILNYNYVLK